MVSPKIKEIIATGGLRAAEKAKQTHNLEALAAFQNIYSVGPTKAKEIVDAGILTIADLRAACAAATKPKFYNDKLGVGLKYYEHLLERIPREEMLQHKAILTEQTTTFDFEIVGSFRRSAADSGDIDVLLSGPAATIKAFRAYVEKLKAIGFITDVLALGDKKCMAICTTGNGKFRRLDLLLTPIEEYAYAILYFTGSDRFNVRMRQIALDRGYSLNEHTLTPMRPELPTPPPMSSEADIFAFLGMEYVAPADRVSAAARTVVA